MAPKRKAASPFKAGTLGKAASKQQIYSNLSELNFQAPLAVGYCSGFGQYHSENNSVSPRLYSTVSMLEIETMAVAPQCKEKPDAQWTIFSTERSRVHQIQRERGQFGAAWIDIDANPHGLQHVINTIKQLFSGVKFIAYLTKSATVDNQKCRVIIPFSSLCPGEVYVLLQKIINDRTETTGILPDRKTELAGQICYLPNRGELYQFHIESGEPLDWETSLSQELAAEKERINPTL